MDDDQIRISETVDRSDPLTVDVVLEVHETIASVSEVDGFVRVRFRAPIAEWNAVLGRRNSPPAPSHPVQSSQGTAELVLTGLVRGGEAAAWHEIPDDAVLVLDGERLTGLVRGGEAATWHEIPDDAVLVLDGERRILPAYDPEHSTTWLAMANSAPKPFAWYCYTNPNPSRTSDPG